MDNQMILNEIRDVFKEIKELLVNKDNCEITFQTLGYYGTTRNVDRPKGLTYLVSYITIHATTFNGKTIFLALEIDGNTIKTPILLLKSSSNSARFSVPYTTNYEFFYDDQNYYLTIEIE